MADLGGGVVVSGVADVPCGVLQQTFNGSTRRNAAPIAMRAFCFSRSCPTNSSNVCGLAVMGMVCCSTSSVTPKPLSDRYGWSPETAGSKRPLHHQLLLLGTTMSPHFSNGFVLRRNLGAMLLDEPSSDSGLANFENQTSQCNTD